MSLRGPHQTPETRPKIELCAPKLEPKSVTRVPKATSLNSMAKPQNENYKLNRVKTISKSNCATRPLLWAEQKTRAAKQSKSYSSAMFVLRGAKHNHANPSKTFARPHTNNVRVRIKPAAVPTAFQP